MKILYIITGLDYGGAEMQVKALTTEMHSRNIEVAIISLISPHPDFDSYFKSLSVPVWDLGLKPGQYNPFVIFKSIQIIKNYKPDIVHSHMVHANIMSRITRLFLRFPVLITTAHNISEGGKMREIAYRYTDFLTDLTTNVSQVATDTYINKRLVSSKKIKFVPNGISFANEKQFVESKRKTYKNEFLISNKMFIWLAIGRLSEQKDFKNLINASVILKKHNNNFKILIAGTGELKEQLEKLVDEKEILDNILFIGVRKDIEDLMLFSDAFVMSSAWEGLPIVLLEAARSRLPIVATNVGGNHEIVIDNKNGRLVPPHNAELLSKAMLEIMSFNKDKLNDFADYGYKTIKELYSIQRIVDIWIEIYNRILKNKS